MKNQTIALLLTSVTCQDRFLQDSSGTSWKDSYEGIQEAGQPCEAFKYKDNDGEKGVD
jgi:hypothetical protein